MNYHGTRSIAIERRGARRAQRVRCAAAPSSAPPSAQPARARARAHISCTLISVARAAPPLSLLQYFRRPAAAARPSASAEQVAPMAPSLPQTSPQPGSGYVFSVIEVELSPAPRRCRQRGPRVHRRRRRGERWRWQCGFAPRAEGDRAGVGRDSSGLRRALQAYGEGPGRSRSGPISIHL